MRDDGRQAVGGHVTLPLQLFHFFEKTTPTIHTLLIAQQMSGTRLFIVTHDEQALQATGGG